MKRILLIGFCLLLVGCGELKETHLVNGTDIKLTELKCDLIEVWNESKDCIYDYCEEKCWIPYGLKLYSVSISEYDFNNNSKIDPDERFVLDQNLKSAKECTIDCFEYPYGCFDYVMDIRCETDLAVNKINITSGEVTKWTPS